MNSLTETALHKVGGPQNVFLVLDVFVASGLDNLSFWWNSLKYASKVSAFFARGRSVEVAKFLLDQGASLSARFSKSEYLYFYILESSRFTSLSVYCPAFEIF